MQGPNKRPPSARRFHKLANEIRRGHIEDFDLMYLCESNVFYMNQLQALLREPEERKQQAIREEEAARKAALFAKRHTLKKTCIRRRKALQARSKLHHNRTYLWLLRMQREALERDKKWSRFVENVRMIRIQQAYGWVHPKDQKYMNDRIFEQDPLQLSDVWPEGSQCVIPEPVMSPDWVMLRPPTPATVVSVEEGLKRRLRTYERALEQAYYSSLGIERPRPSITTIDSNGQRITTGSQSADPTTTQPTYEFWLEEQLQPPIPGEESNQEDL